MVRRAVTVVARILQIQSVATWFMNHFGGYNANATYFVFTPHGHSMSGFVTNWCAWHDKPISGIQGLQV